MTKPFKPTKKHSEKQWKNAILVLNDLITVRLAPSSIHGVGVIALKDMKKGRKMNLNSKFHNFDVPYSKFHLLTEDAREILLSEWPQIVNGSHFIYPVTMMQAFLNHSDDPNYDGLEDTLLKDVKKGEEITENYKLIPNWEKIYKWLK